MSLCGRLLIPFKMILDCKQRSAQFTPALIKRSQDLNVNLEDYRSNSVNTARQEVYKRRNDLWEAQKTCETDRLDWLKGEASSEPRQWRTKTGRVH